MTILTLAVTLRRLVSWPVLEVTGSITWVSDNLSEVNKSNLKSPLVALSPKLS